jgi:signal transduction histidine kinase
MCATRGRACHPRRPPGCSNGSTAPISSRARASGGTGLGVSIVQALVIAHGGTVGADSAPGRGTTFTVVLPRS